MIVFGKYLGSNYGRYCPRCGGIVFMNSLDCSCGGLGEGIGKAASWTSNGYDIKEGD